MPLAKIFTKQKTRNILLLWVREITQSVLEPALVDDFMDLATLDVAEILNGATLPDYGRTATLNNAASSVSTNKLTLTTYTDLTRTINDAAHGFTAADIGRRIVLWNTGDDRYMISTIESITDVDNFIVQHALGVDCGPIDYFVVPEIAVNNLSISTLKLSHIAKISDSTNGEWIEVKTKEFENLENFTQKQNNVYWYRHGQTIYFYKGTSAGSIGTITCEYFGYPELPASDSDYLDIRDFYVPLVIAKTKNYIYEHLNKTPPEALTNIISQRSAMVREANLAEKTAGKLST